jgi:ABC-type uncharacterized transport system permease subunit
MNYFQIISNFCLYQINKKTYKHTHEFINSQLTNYINTIIVDIFYEELINENHKTN